MAFKLLRFRRRRTVTVDAGLFTDTESVHEAFRKALGREDYVGSNLDALHDILTTTFSSTTLRVVNFAAAERTLGEYAASLRRVLTDSAEQNSCLRVEITD
jgi:RNAse (barnase) inhibitor barstar